MHVCAYTGDIDYEWDVAKARNNRKKHGVAFADVVTVLEDEQALTIQDPDPDEERFITIGWMRSVGYWWWSTRGGAKTRSVLSRRGKPRRLSTTSMRKREAMKARYNFSKGKRGAVVRVPGGKTRITIRLDDEVLEWFRAQVEEAGGRNYQTLINDALQEHIRQHREPLEAILRRVVREELRSVE